MPGASDPGPRKTTPLASPWRAAGKYAALQLPGLLLLCLILLLVRSWFELSWWAFAGLLGLWALKDVALFPFVWRAYDPALPGEEHNMVGTRGIARERLSPSGYVLVRGELWRALVTGDASVEAGSAVRVVEVDGLTLRVAPENDGGEKR